MHYIASFRSPDAKLIGIRAVIAAARFVRAPVEEIARRRKRRRSDERTEKAVALEKPV